MKSVRLYTMTGNPDGEAALAFFLARGVRVEVRDVGKDEGASLELFNLAGRLAVPAVVIDEQLFPGFAENREKIESLLRE